MVPPKWFPKWFLPNGSKWFPNGSKWFQMVPKWFQHTFLVATRFFKWFQHTFLVATRFYVFFYFFFSSINKSFYSLSSVFFCTNDCSWTIIKPVFLIRKYRFLKSIASPANFKRHGQYEF